MTSATDGARIAGRGRAARRDSPASPPPAAPSRRLERRRSHRLRRARLPCLLDDLDGLQAGQRDHLALADLVLDASRRSNTSVTPWPVPYFWEVVKNSLIIVGLVVALSMVVAFLAAVALAKYRFTGNKLFVVLVIGILMLPQAGLVIPLYVVLAKLPPDEPSDGLVLTLPRDPSAVRGLDAPGVHHGHPEGARGGGDGRRLEPARRVHAHPAPLVAPGSSRRPCSSSSRAGTSTSSPTSSSPTSRTRPSRSGSHTSTGRAARPTGAG